MDLPVEDAQLGFRVSGRDSNLMVYMHLPEAKVSFWGMCLLCWADFPMGTHVNTFWRTLCGVHLGAQQKVSGVGEQAYHVVLHTGRRHRAPANQAEKTSVVAAGVERADHCAASLPTSADLERRVDAGWAVVPVLLNICLHLSTVERRELDKKISAELNLVPDDLVETDGVPAHL